MSSASRPPTPGDTSQDLKTGYIVGSTPRLQQIALMIGVVVSTVVIGFTLDLMNTGLQEFHAMAKPWNLHAAHPGVAVEADTHRLPSEIRVVAPDANPPRPTRSRSTTILNSIGSSELQDGKYLYSPATGQIDRVPGFRASAAPALPRRRLA